MTGERRGAMRAVAFLCLGLVAAICVGCVRRRAPLSPAVTATSADMGTAATATASRTPPVDPTSTPLFDAPTETEVPPTATLTPAPTPTHTPTPALMPSATWTLTREPTETATPAPPTPSTMPSPSPTPTEPPPTPTSTLPPPPTATARPMPGGGRPITDRERFGVGAATDAGGITDYEVERLGIGWYLNWGVAVDPARPGGAAFWQMVRLSEKGHYPQADTIRAAAAANPGSVWLIGNEPDCIWQDGVTPERYAALYGELYGVIKGADPTSRIGIGGVSQPTPLRLRYLERVLASYEAQYGEAMPVDVWNVHGFLLREERDSWGVDIPPGFTEQSGVLYEIEDHDDLEAFRSQILGFRQWMAAQGQRDRPLVVSEYGVLMPVEYGFDAERVRVFMEGTFDYFVTARDEEVGYSADDSRLVQWWAWYSLADITFPAGNLFDPATKDITPLGAAFSQYTARYP